MIRKWFRARLFALIRVEADQMLADVNTAVNSYRATVAALHDRLTIAEAQIRRLQTYRPDIRHGDGT